MNKYDEKIRELEKQQKILAARKQKILNFKRKNTRAFETKRKIVAGALLISGAEKDPSLRKALLKVISNADSKDVSLFTELKELYSEKKNDEAKPANAEEVKSENDSPKADN